MSHGFNNGSEVDRLPPRQNLVTSVISQRFRAFAKRYRQVSLRTRISCAGTRVDVAVVPVVLANRYRPLRNVPIPVDHDYVIA